MRQFFLLLVLFVLVSNHSYAQDGILSVSPSYYEYNEDRLEINISSKREVRIISLTLDNENLDEGKDYIFNGINLSGKGVITLLNLQPDVLYKTSKLVIHYEVGEGKYDSVPVDILYKPRKMYVLSIGVSSYNRDNIDSLQWPASAANTVDSLLLKQCPLTKYHELADNSYFKAGMVNVSDIDKIFNNLIHHCTDNSLATVIVYLSGHATCQKENNQNVYYFQASDKAISQKNLIRYISNLAGISPKTRVLVFIDTCYSGLLVSAIENVRQKYDNLFVMSCASDSEEVVDGTVFASAILSSLSADSEYLDYLINQRSDLSLTSQNVANYISSIMHLRGHQPKWTNNQLFLLSNIRPKTPDAQTDTPKNTYSESWLPYSLTKEGSFSFGESIGEKASFISEVTCLAGTIGFIVWAQSVWGAGNRQREQYLYTNSYAQLGKTLTWGIGVSFAGLVGSYFWHHSAVRNRLKKQNENGYTSGQTSIRIAPQIGYNYASIGAVVSF